MLRLEASPRERTSYCVSSIGGELHSPVALTLVLDEQYERECFLLFVLDPYGGAGRRTAVYPKAGVSSEESACLPQTSS